MTHRSYVLFLLALFALSPARAGDGPAGDPAPESAFPTTGLLPKAEIGALRLLEQHAEYDGRGVTVAIFDTGVDPGAAGLQETTDGRPKIVDVVDATGSGDVETWKVVEPEGETFEGLSGRELRVDSDWPNPSGKFRLGITRAYDFFPGGLVSRLKRERKERFQEEQRKTEAELRAELEAWQAEHPRPNAGQKLWQQELERRIEALRTLSKRYDDPGPVFDCIVFHDGDVWRAVVDTDEDGDLAEEDVLTDFRRERQYDTFGEDALLNFAVNVYDDGQTLSIVTDAGAHGTHVAGIVAGHFPDRPELNGIAPGARIVSVKIGDSRLGSMETGAGLERGLAAVLENDCDAINMSYGEPTHTPDRGRLVELFTELVDEHGVVFVASAGNSGPALSTVGAPGGTTSAVMGVGAYVSPAMMQAAYALRDELPETAYTWTSRGPTSDGDFGVDVFAPGGAIAPVPHWTLRRNQRMNGTSMASPNACGAVALLLSAAKATETPCTPYAVRRALQNTARPVETVDGFAQGPGLIQVDAALEHLLAHAKSAGEGLRYAVSVDEGGERGVYLREPHETREPLVTDVRVRPVFPKRAEKRPQVDFELRLALEPQAEWVTCGAHVLMTRGGASFEMQVDPTVLEPGPHQTFVAAYDATHRERGPLFRVPITVVVPEPVGESGAESVTGEFESAAGTVERRFVAVPEGATWADVELVFENEHPAAKRTVLVHAVQLAGGEHFEEREYKRYVSLQPGHATVLGFAVEPGRTLELVLAQYWSSLGEGRLGYELHFHGLVPTESEVDFVPGEATREVEVRSPIRPERLDPRARLETRRSVLRPTKHELRPLKTPRDRLPDGTHTHELLLTYEFEQPGPGRVTPRFPSGDGLLYESPYGGLLWNVYDSAKRRVATGDAYEHAPRLDRGKHQLVLRLRHADVAELEDAKDWVLWLERPLKSSVSLDVFDSRSDAAGDRRAFRDRRIERGERVRLSVAAPKKAPSGCEPGDVLVGTITWGEADERILGANRRPGGWPLRWVVPPEAKSGADDSSPKPPSDKDDDSTDDRERAIRDLLVQRLQDVPTDAEKRFQTLYAELRKEYPDHRPILVAKLDRLDTVERRKQHLPEIVAVCDEVLATFDTGELARGLGTRALPHDPESARRRRELERERDRLAKVLYRKGRALGYMELPDVIEKHPIADPQAHDEAFEANFRELARWVDTTEKDYALLHVRRDRRKERYGHALELLDDLAADSAPFYWYDKKRRDVYEKLGWQHAWEYQSRWLMIRFPKRREPL